MSLNAREIAQAISHQEWSNEELNSFVMAIRYNRTQMTRHAVRSLQRGDKVRFKSRSGAYAYGVVERIKIKNVMVRINNFVYTVPASLLEHA